MLDYIILINNNLSIVNIYININMLIYSSYELQKVKCI